MESAARQSADTPESQTRPAVPVCEASDRKRTALAPWPLERRLAAAATALCVLYAVFVLPRVATGPCFNDPGELQVASGTLGITHPPGYATYVLLGWLICRLPLAEPATLISAANAAAGLAALMLALLLQLRWGAGIVPALLALAWLVTRPPVFAHLVRPEVYAPSLALLLGAIVLLFRWHRQGGWGRLVCAAALFGLLLANRPSAVAFVPGLVLCVVVSPHRRQLRIRPVRRLTAVLAVLMLPSIVTVVYVWLRDRPDIAYNYMAINQHNTRVFEPGWYESSTKWQHLAWLLSAAEYHGALARSWRDVVGQLAFLRDQLGWPYWTTLLGVLALVSTGLAVLARQKRGTAAVVVALLAGNLSFTLCYRQAGLPSMALPLLCFVACLAGVGLTALVSALRAGRSGELAAVAAFAGLAWWHADSDLLRGASDSEASGFLRGLDLASLPPDVVLFTHVGGHVQAMAYELAVRCQRRDTRIVPANPADWPELARLAQTTGKRVFYTTDAPVPDGCRLKARGALWELVRRGDGGMARTGAPGRAEKPPAG